MRSKVSLHILFFFLPFLSIAQTRLMDSLVSIIRTGPEDTNKVNALGGAAWELIKSGNYDTSIVYSLKAKSLGEKLNYRKGVARAYNNLGAIDMQQGNYPKALENYYLAVKIRKEIRDLRGLAISLNNIGICCWKLGDRSGALKNYFASLKIKEQIGDKKGMIASYNNIGIIYNLIPNYKEALKNYEAARTIAEEIGPNELFCADIYSNIGIINNENENYEAALANYEKALKIEIAANAKDMMASSYTNIGITNYFQGNFEASEKNHLEGIRLKKEMNDIAALVSSYNAIGTLYIKQKRYAEAGKYIEEALRIAKETGQKEGIRSAYQELEELSEKTGQWEKATQYQKLYAAVKDSIFNETVSKQITETEAKYQNEKKQKEIELLSQKNENQQLQLSRNRYLIFGLSGVAILILVIAYLVIRQNKLRERQAQIELQQKLLLSQTKALHAQMNPHFIFNCMASIQSFMTQNDPASSAKFLSKFARLIRATLENSQQPYVSLDSEIKMLEDYIELESLRHAGKFTYNIKADPSLDTEMIEIPSMLIQPYIENAILHGLGPKKDGQGRIEINFSVENNLLRCTVKDNGVGRKKAREIKESMGLGHHSMGMSITEERLSLLNRDGKSKVSSTITDLYGEQQEPIGTLVEINVPLNTA